MLDINDYNYSVVVKCLEGIIALHCQVQIRAQWGGLLLFFFVFSPHCFVQKSAGQSFFEFGLKTLCSKHKALT